MARGKPDKGDAEGTIRLFIYSGRPDPEWKIEPTERKHLEQLLRGVVNGDEVHPPPPGGLGYRGFLVRGVPLTRESASDVEVFRGVVTEHAGRRLRHWRDVSGVERWLLEQARRQGHDKILEDEGLASEEE